MYHALSLIFNSGLIQKILFSIFIIWISINHFSMCG